MAAYRIDASAAELMARARQDTGVDILDTDIQERLERLVQSLDTEAQLSAAGAAAMTDRLLRLLSNRLRMFRDLDAHPEILDQPVAKPIFLTSAPRTGSTKLHKLLAASCDFRYLKGWQALTLGPRTGDRDEDPAPRITDSDRYAAWFNQHAPDAMAIHEYATREPDEDSLIYEHCLYGPYLIAFAFIPSYVQWYVEARDFTEDLAFFTQALKYLQWQFHDGDQRRWLLKSPVYLGLEPLVAAAFPDAAFITTNREPYSVMASSASLCKAYQEAHSEASIDAFLGPMMLEGFGTAMQYHLAGRDTGINYFDVGYTELTQHSERVVDQVYAHLGVELTDPARKATQEWEQENRQHKHGVHRYQLEDFGLTRELVETKFGGYLERFGHKF